MLRKIILSLLLIACTFLNCLGAQAEEKSSSLELFKQLPLDLASPYRASLYGLELNIPEDDMVKWMMNMPKEIPTPPKENPYIVKTVNILNATLMTYPNGTPSNLKEREIMGMPAGHVSVDRLFYFKTKKFNEEARKSFLDHSAEKRKKTLTDSGFKILEEKRLTISGATADKTIAKSEERGQYVLLYNIASEKGVYIVNSKVLERNYAEFMPALEKLFENLKFVPAYEEINIAGTNYSYFVPASFINLGKMLHDNHVYTGSSMDPESLMSGVIADPMKGKKKYNYMPASLANLDAEKKAKLTADIVKDVQENSKDNPQNITTDFIMQNGEPCVKVEFDEVTSHSISYIFVKDGKYVSFDYIYPAKHEAAIRPVVNKSVSTIRLEKMSYPLSWAK